MGKRKSREEPEALPMINGAEDNPTDMSPEPTPKKTKKDKREKKEKKEKGEKGEKGEKREKREKKEKKEKKEKRKHHEEPDALPDADIAEDETPVSVADEPTHKKDRKDRKQKSKKRRINEEGDAVEVDETGKTGEDVTDEEGKEPKLSKKAKWRAARRKRAEEPEDGGGDDGGDVEGDVKGEEGPDEGAEGKKTKKQRFLLFIGNLPYTATTKDVEKHFAKVKPQDVRLLTTKSEDGSDISRGCAFVELDSARMMDKALLRMHHSEFDDGKSEKRKINVEVTAGGGGCNPARMEKIKAKNAKLDEERARKAQKAADLKEAEKNNKEKKARAEDDVNNEGKAEDLKSQEEEGKEDEQDDTAGVHPSRLAQMSSNYQDQPWEGRENGDRRGGFKGGRGGRGGGRGFGRGRGRGGSFRSGRGGRRRGGGGGFRGAA